jgi:hypothetical protein
VNAGAGEVAKVFLNPDKIANDTKEIQVKIHGILSNENKQKEQRYQIKLLQLKEDLLFYNKRVHRLKVTLANFLQLSKLLLLKCRNILVADQSILDKSKVLDNVNVKDKAFNDMNELIPLTYPSISSGNASQSMNLNNMGLGGGGAGPSSMGSTGTSSNMRASISVLTASNTFMNSGSSTSNNPPVMVTPLASLWKATSENLNLTTRETGSTSSNQASPGVATALSSTNSGSSSQPPVALTAQEINNIKWQLEMEKGFDALVQAIYPYIADIKEAEIFNVGK